MFGFISGIYVGTKYDCKPMLKRIEEMVKNNLPNEK